MKKLIAVLLAMVMVFSMSSVCAFAAEDTTEQDGILDFEHGNTGNDEEIEDTYYSLLNFFADLLERINLLFEYIMTVFFPNANA